MNGYNASVPIYSYDLALAASYLENATHGSSNWLADGFKLELYYNSGSEARETACLMIKAGLEAISSNIEITVTPVEWSHFVEILVEGSMPAFLDSWAPDYPDPDCFMQPLYLSGNTFSMDTGYENATLDDKIMAAAYELNETRRAEMYMEISMDMYRECVYIWIDQPTSFFVGYDYIEGYYYNPMYSNLYYYDLSKKTTR